MNIKWLQIEYEINESFNIRNDEYLYLANNNRYLIYCDNEGAIVLNPFCEVDKQNEKINDFINILNDKSINIPSSIRNTLFSFVKTYLDYRSQRSFL